MGHVRRLRYYRQAIDYLNGFNCKDTVVTRVVLLLLTFFIFCLFLADRTNGRTIATLLRLSSSSVVCLSSSVTLCIVAKRCVLEQKLLWRAYRKSYMRNRLVPK